MIPEGIFPAVVVPVPTDNGMQAVQFGRSKTKQTPQALVCFEILRGPEAGQKISWFGYFTDATADRTLESLKLCGFKGDDLHTYPDQRPENEVSIVVEHEEYEGKPRAKVQWVNAPGGVLKTANPMNASDLRKFGAQLKGKLKQLGDVDGKKAERQPASASPPADDGWHGNDAPDPPPPGQDDDGIPF